MFGFPNDHFTVRDRSTETGRRVALAPDATPANAAGVHIDPTELNRNDGFSPGSAIAVLLPGIAHGQGRDQLEVLTVASTFLEQGILVDTCAGGPCQTLPPPG